MKLVCKKIVMKPNESIGVFRFGAGTFTELPGIEYKNTNDFPTLVYGEIDPDAAKYLGSDINFIQKYYIIMPGETKKINFKFFRVGTSNILYSRGAFSMNIVEVPFVSPEYVKKLVDNTLKSEKNKEVEISEPVKKVIEEKKEEVKKEKIETSVEEKKEIDFNSLSDEEAEKMFLEKFCKMSGEETPLYKKWAEAGKPKEVLKYERPINVGVYLKRLSEPKEQI